MILCFIDIGHSAGTYFSQNFIAFCYDRSRL